MVDILAFGPHPDDIEIGAGGVLADAAARGLRVGLVDLTRGEMGTNGTPETRLAEGELAAQELGASWRHNLGLGDRALSTGVKERSAVVAVLRATRPRLVLIPYGEGDRHPDHRSGAQLLREALFDSGLTRFAPETGAPYRLTQVLHYIINARVVPQIIIPIAGYHRKEAALGAHRSQFGPGLPTELNGGYLRQIAARDIYFGRMVGADYGEGFIMDGPVRIGGLGSWIDGL